MARVQGAVSARDFLIPGLMALLFALLAATGIMSPGTSHSGLPGAGLPHVRFEELWIPTEMAAAFLLLCAGVLGCLRAPPLVSAALWLAIPLALTPGWVRQDCAFDTHAIFWPLPTYVPRPRLLALVQSIPTVPFLAHSVHTMLPAVCLMTKNCLPDGPAVIPLTLTLGGHGSCG